METYLNYSGSSGVSEYEIGDDYIIVVFHNGGAYLYTYDTPGSEQVEQMKTLAGEGKGLNSYINKYVRKNYHKKL